MAFVTEVWLWCLLAVASVFHGCPSVGGLPKFLLRKSIFSGFCSLAEPPLQS